MTEKILCFGDSNTWGYAPEDGRRYNDQERWPALMAEYLPHTVCVIEQGQPGRTTRFDYPSAGLASGTAALTESLQACRPDLVVLMLGTNDLATRFDQSAEQIADNVAEMARQILESDPEKPPQVMLVAPPEINEIGHFGDLFQGGAEKSRQFSQYFAAQAEALGIHFFDAAQVVPPGKVDGIHWEAPQHSAFARALANAIRTNKLVTD